MGRALKIIFIIAVLAGIAFLVRFLLKPDPQAVLRTAERNLLFASAVRYDVTLSATGDLAAAGLQDASAQNGALAGDVATDADLRTVPGASSSQFRFTFKDPSGREASVSGESMKKDGVHYLKLDDAGALAQTGIESILGKWTKTRRHLLRWLFPPSDRVLAERPLDAAGWKQMKDAIAVADALRVTETMPDDGSGKDALWHFKVKVQHDSVVALLLKWRQLRIGADVGQDDLIAATAEADSWGEPSGDVWIGKRDGRLRQVTLTSEAQLAQGKDAVAMTIAFSDYGKVPAIKVPDAEDLETALGAVSDARLRLAGDRAFQAPATSTPEAASATPEVAVVPAKELDTDGDGLPDSQEFFYGSDAWNPDTDGDGYQDGQEFDNGMSPTGPGSLFSFGLGG